MERKKSILGRIAGSIRAGDALLSRRQSIRTKDAADASSTRSTVSSSAAAIDPMDVERLFPEAIRSIDERLESTPFSTEQKTQIVREYLRRGSTCADDPSTSSTTQTLLLLKKLKAVHTQFPPSTEVFSELRVLFRAEGVEWLKGFAESGGLKAWTDAVLRLGQLLIHDVNFHSVISNSLRSFTNNKYGLRAASREPGVYTILCVLCLASDAIEVVQPSLQLLTVLCLLDPSDTHSNLLHGASNARLMCHQELMFEGLHAFVVRHAGSLADDFWIDYCIFVNAVVGSRDSDDDVRLRVHLRSLLFRGRVRSALEDVYETTGNDTLLKQLDFFFALLEQDRELIQGSSALCDGTSGVECDDEAGCVKKLKELPTFYSLLRLVLAAPLDTRSQYCAFMHSCLQEMVMRGSGINPDFALLPSFVVDVGPLVSAFSDQQYKQLETALRDATERLNYMQRQKDLAEVSFAERITKLREELEERERARVSELIQRLDDGTRETEKLRETITLLEMERAPSDGRRDSVKMSAIETKEEQEQPKPATATIAIAPQANINRLALPPPPPPPLPTSQISRLSAPPLPPSSVVTPPLAAPTAPKTTARAPRSRMRPLQWHKLPDHCIPGTVWDGMNEAKWEPKIDFERLLDSRFSIRNQSSSADIRTAASASSAASPSASSPVFTFLTTKQSTNLEIALRKWRVPTSTADQHFLAMDRAVFTEEIVGELCKLEIGSGVLASGGSTHNSIGCERLSTAEAFIWALYKVPGYELRLKCLRFRALFEEWLVQTNKSVETVKIAVNKINNEAVIKHALELILLMGNYLNAGTFRGNAKGIDIDSLSILPTTKSIDGKTAFIHSLAEAIQKSNTCYGPPPYAALECVFREASIVNLQSAREELRQHEQDLQAIDEGLASYSTHDERDKLLAVMLPFASSANASLQAMQHALQQTQETLSALCKYYAANISGSSNGDTNSVGNGSEGGLFGMVAAFLQDLSRAAADNALRAQEDEAREKRTNRSCSARQQSSRLRALFDTANDNDRNMVDGLLGALKHI